MLRTATALGFTLAALALSGCSTTGHPAQAALSPSALGHDTSARAICLSGVHSTPVENIVVNRAIAAPLSAVKAWVLRDHRIDWRTYSSSLTDAPLNERVAVCVFSKRDGTRFTMPPGTNPPQPQQSVVEIVRPNGRGGALVMTGSLMGMLEVAPTSIKDLRHSTS